MNKNLMISVLDTCRLLGSLIQDRLQHSFPEATIHLLTRMPEEKCAKNCPHYLFINVEFLLRTTLGHLAQLKNRCFSTEESIIIAYASQTYPVGMYKQLMKEGIQGIVTADECSTSIASALEIIRTQGFYISAALQNSLMNFECQRFFKDQSKTGLFSPRELDVFMRLGRGMSVKEIADNLCVSPKTIQTYRERIKKKMEVNDSQSLAFHAFKTCSGMLL
ncbi:MAG: LuxR C-terminal-related transcriptional regulator [Kiritimatiellae bacterium]|nr:LuxR C-terminal-related transcriptional regulator [Kiritimatiellia bacterium]